MTNLSSELRDLQDPVELTSRLTAVCHRYGLQRLAVGLRLQRQTSLVETDGAGTPKIIAAPQCRQACGSCLVKPITASLSAEAVAAGKVAWSTPVSEVLGIGDTADDKFQGVSFGQLLDHTHGLDSLLTDGMPRTPGGFVDLPALRSSLSRRRLSEAGELYSYGSVGFWLAAAALERVEGRAYGKLLAETPLLQPIGALGKMTAGGVCPATGGALELTVSQWLSFLELQFDENSGSLTPYSTASCLAPLRRQRVAMPGWSPAEQAACIGWKYYGDGWYGHNAHLGNSSALLRFNLTQEIAVAVIADGDAAFFALTGLFGAALPEVARLKVPRLLGPQAASALRPDSYTGTYSRARTRITISGTASGAQPLSFNYQYAGDREFSGRLRPAENDIFFPERKGISDLPFVQFVRSARSGDLEYLWNGKQVWRRERGSSGRNAR